MKFTCYQNFFWDLKLKMGVWKWPFLGGRWQTWPHKCWIIQTYWLFPMIIIIQDSDLFIQTNFVPKIPHHHTIPNPILLKPNLEFLQSTEHSYTKKEGLSLKFRKNATKCWGVSKTQLLWSMIFHTSYSSRYNIFKFEHLTIFLT